MNIGIDISQIVYKGTGVSRFTKGLVDAILRYDTDNNWTFFFSSFRQKLDPETARQIQEKGHSLIELPLPPTILSLLFNDLHSLSKLVTQNSPLVTKLDFFVTSDWTEPALPCKKATIVHDLVFRKYPETVHPKILKTQHKRLRHVAKESDLIFVDSKSTGTDLAEEYGIAKERIVVDYPGVETLQTASLHKNDILNTYNIQKPYILTVGKLEPRKNIPRLIKAFSRVMEQQNNEAIQLIIVGQKGWGKLDISSSSNVNPIGFVDDDVLAVLYSEALAFIYPSLYEGFGYPIVEAMRYGCPVATSNTSSLAEVAGDAALLFDPHNTKSITQAVAKLISDGDLRKKLTKKGKERSSLYTWKSYLDTLIKKLRQDRKY